MQIPAAEFLGVGASNDSWVVDDIFGYFGGYLF